MTLNIIAYILFLTITYLVTVKVGWICYKNGIHFIYMELQDMPLSETINRLLLTGYYLLNLGYASLMIYHWQHVESIHDLIESIAYKSGGIILLLGIMHYFNILVIYFTRKKKTL